MLRNLGAKGRTRAVRGAFDINPRFQDVLKHKNIVLVDDVYTSGATANECARILKRAGATNVIVLCWARVLIGD
jgi:predicted amidophosphoribosyltransferase